MDEIRLSYVQMGNRYNIYMYIYYVCRVYCVQLQNIRFVIDGCS